MLFDSEFLAAIPSSPYPSVVQAINRAFSILEDNHEWSAAEHESLLEVYALISSMREAGLVTFVIDDIDIPSGNAWSQDCSAMRGWLERIRESCEVNASKSSFEKLKQGFTRQLGGGFHYQFSPADVSRIQILISELRERIANSNLFEAGHRERLLKRLEALQSEVHKHVSDLDKFWGLLGDAGVALGKFGVNAKPIVDRMVEISQIVWNSQKEAESIPSNVPMPLLLNGNRTEPEQSGE